MWNVIFTVLMLSSKLTSYPQWLPTCQSPCFAACMEVQRVVPCGSLDQRRVHIPGMLVDSWHRKCRESTYVIWCHMMSYDVIWCHMLFDRVFWAHLWMGKKWSCLFGESPGLFLCTVQCLNGPTGLPFRFDVVGQVVFLCFTIFLWFLVMVTFKVMRV